MNSAIKKTINEAMSGIAHSFEGMSSIEKSGIESLSVKDTPKKMPVIKTTADNTIDLKALELEELKNQIAWLEERHGADTEIIGQLQSRELIRQVEKSVQAERLRQDTLWGHQRHDYGKWLAILMEEVGEVAQAMQKNLDWSKESDAGDLYTELIQVSAVARAFAEQVLEEQRNA